MKKNNYKWEKNKRGEVKVRRDTEETLSKVCWWLKRYELPYEIFVESNSVRIDAPWKSYCYYWTTGRWAPYNKRGLPKKHYRSNGIEDFLDRFCKPFEKETRQ